MARSNNLPSLDGIRGIGAIIVVALHSDLYFAVLLNCNALQHRLAGDLHVAVLVDVFFMLSGLVMSHVYSGCGIALSQFYIARISRIFPLYFSTLAAVAVITPYSFVPASIDMSGSTLLKHLTFTGFHNATMGWNYPSWSVQVEIYCYLLYPAAAVAVRRCSRTWMVFAALACCGLFSLCLVGSAGSLNIVAGNRSLARGLCAFFVGMLLYQLRRSGWAERNRRVILGGTWGSLLTFLAIWRHDTFLLITLAGTLVLCLDHCSLLFTALNCHFARRLGDWSYSIYLWHPAVHYSIAALILGSGAKPQVGSIVAVMLSIVLTVLVTLWVARWSYILIEVPGRRWIRSAYEQTKGRGVGAEERQLARR